MSELPKDALKLIDDSAELLLRGIERERSRLLAAVERLGELADSISKHLPLNKGEVDGKDNDRDDSSRLRAAVDAIANDTREFREFRVPNLSGSPR
jgi:hypothetical protein